MLGMFTRKGTHIAANLRCWRSNGPRKLPTLGKQASARGYTTQWGGSGDASVLHTLIAGNIAGWGLWQLAGPEGQRLMMNHATVSMNDLMKLKLHTLVLSNFSNPDAIAAGLNSLVLWWLGSGVASSMTSRRFLQLYVGGGAAAFAVAAALPLVSESLRLRWGTSKYERTLGARGAMNSLMTYYVFMNPTSTIYLWMVLPVPAAILGAGWLGMDLYQWYEGSRSKAALGQSIGGMAYGAAFFLLTRRRFSY
ncbi:unnamed protein product [Chrysoparadoxa australica]